MDLEKVETIVLIAGVGLGAYVIYKSLTPATESVGEIVKETVDVSSETIETGRKLAADVFGGRSDTVGLGEECVHNSDCALSGIAGGYSAKLADKIGCCEGICTEKKKDWAGIYWCEVDLPEATFESIIKETPLINTEALGGSCFFDGDCSISGVAGGAPARIADEIGCCNGICKNKPKGFLDIYWCPI